MAPLRRVKLSFIRGSALTGFVFFSSLEIVHYYCASLDIYRNFATDFSFAAIPTYSLLVAYLRRNPSAITHYPVLRLSQIRAKAFKYALLLSSVSSFFEMTILFKRR